VLLARATPPAWRAEPLVGWVKTTWEPEREEKAAASSGFVWPLERRASCKERLIAVELILTLTSWGWMEKIRKRVTR